MSFRIALFACGVAVASAAYPTRGKDYRIVATKNEKCFGYPHTGEWWHNKNSAETPGLSSDVASMHCGFPSETKMLIHTGFTWKFTQILPVDDPTMFLMMTENKDATANNDGRTCIIKKADGEIGRNKKAGAASNGALGCGLSHVDQSDWDDSLVVNLHELSAGKFYVGVFGDMGAEYCMNLETSKFDVHSSVLGKYCGADNAAELESLRPEYVFKIEELTDAPGGTDAKEESNGDGSGGGGGGGIIAGVIVVILLLVAMAAVYARMSKSGSAGGKGGTQLTRRLSSSNSAV